MAFFERLCGFFDNGRKPTALQNIPLPLDRARVRDACILAMTDEETIQTIKEKLPLRAAVDDSGLSDQEDFQNWIDSCPTDANPNIRKVLRMWHLEKFLASVGMQNENMAGRLWAGYEIPNAVREQLGLPVATYPGEGG